MNVDSEELIHMVKEVPGVAALAVIQDWNIISQHAPDTIDEAAVKESAKAARNMVEGMSMTGIDVARVNLHSPDFATILQPAGEYMILVLAEKNVDFPQLNSALDQLMEGFLV